MNKKVEKKQGKNILIIFISQNGRKKLFSFLSMWFLNDVIVILYLSAFFKNF